MCDMGIGKVKRITETTLTSVSKGPGTYPYTVPEMFRTGHRGPPVDIYSLGCLLIELFERVWPGLDGPDVIIQIMGIYDTPPQMPDSSHLFKALFDTICRQVCQLDPARRPKSEQVLKMIRGYSIAIEKINDILDI